LFRREFSLIICCKDFLKKYLIPVPSPYSIFTGCEWLMKTGFGWIEVKGRRYDHDIIIHADGTVTKRKKNRSRAFRSEYGHTPLSGEELGSILDEHPVVVYIGTGQYGSLPLTPDASTLLMPFDPVIMPTPDLLPLLDTEVRCHVAVIHVTC
jgi:hypothetical protein